MKTAALISIVFLLSGCVVADMDSTNYEYVPYAQTYQKADRIGHTDRQQRKEDMYSCGVDRNINLDDGKWNGSSAKPGETLQQVAARDDKLKRCMQSKGYVALGYDQCGPLKAPTGECN